MALTYDFHYQRRESYAASMDVVIWNFLDFEHVNHFHRTSFAHCKVLARSGNVNYLEYGHRRLGKLPFWIKRVNMYHEFIPPNRIRHISIGPFGGYVRVNVSLRESTKVIDGKESPWTDIDHRYRITLPFFMKPLEWYIKRYMNKWAEQLILEDGAMITRRQKVLSLGFKDYLTVAKAEDSKAVLDQESIHSAKAMDPI